MKQYLVEFEFKTEVGNYYWFPLYINAENAILAEVSAVTVKKALEKHYILERKSKVQLVVDGINAEILTQYVNNRLKGKVKVLEFGVWRFKDIPTNPELSFDEHFKLVEYLDIFPGDEIATRVERHEFPVRLYSSVETFEEYLLVNVVDPSNIKDYYIIIEIADKEYLKGNLEPLTEGIWRDAHLKGYKVRVDAPHTADGKRHVHIAHSKHTSAKAKQVSWNQDLSRHDKKSFDDNFVGIERAKEIAIKELGLANDTILEALQLQANLLLEGVQAEGLLGSVVYLRLTKA